MRADIQRITSAIRKIANTDPEKRDSLAGSDSKGGKPGAAGVGSSSEAKQAQVCCDGAVGDPNPGTEERHPSSGGQAGLDASDPAKLSNGDGTLSGVTDCATGEPICFSGSGFIPPDGWDDSDSKPLIDGYEEGFFWTLGTGTQSTQCCSIAPTAELSEALRSQCGISSINTLWKRQCPPPLSCPEANREYACNPPDEVIYQQTWPEDGCTNLAIVGGKIVGSKYDPENDGSYSAPRDSIDLCSGGDQISLAPAANGGFKTINPTTDSGYLYNSKNERIAHIDGNEYSDPTI